MEEKLTCNSGFRGRTLSNKWLFVRFEKPWPPRAGLDGRATVYGAPDGLARLLARQDSCNLDSASTNSKRLRAKRAPASVGIHLWRVRVASYCRENRLPCAWLFRRLDLKDLERAG